MRHVVRLVTIVLVPVAVLVLLGVSVETQDRGRGPLRALATSLQDVREWDNRVVRMERAGNLALRKVQPDTLAPARAFRRFDQYYQGIPVWGGEVVVETDRRVVVSVLSNLFQGIAVSTEPRFTPDQARRTIERLSGGSLSADRPGKLVVFPTDDGTYRLAYTQRVATLRDVRRYFIDANTGERLRDYSEIRRQSAVGTGTGVLGDVKKISTTLLGDGLYYANDILRPPALYTLDLRGNVYRYIAWLNGQVHVQQSDFGTDADNVWTDPALVDAHVHLGWTYDYFYKVHGRKGLDDKNVDLMAIVHAVHRSDLERYVDSGLIDDLSDLYVNAFYLSPGLFTFGEGLPGGWTYGGQSYNYMAGELGIVAHEYTHGVSDYASHLDYEGEPRSLDEAFSDMMGVSVDYYYKPGTANYVVGEEVVSGGFRSLSNPAAYGGIDHYSKRRPWLGYEYDNMSIASHAFYLAIEGGTNRTSGLAVQGVGAANRQLIEKCFYRGFTSLTSQATFGLARRRTIESAQVLYGSGSAAERAITQAWNAVGVQ